jgi:hypothetical protein
MHLPTHSTVVGYAALVLAMSGTAYAATGGTLVLGHRNATGATTSLTNTGGGPALRLSTKRSTTPALTVPNRAKIIHLNADRLDGLDSADLQRRDITIGAHVSSATPGPKTAAKVGPWTITLACTRSGASLLINGPGYAGGSTTVAEGSRAATTNVSGLVSIPAVGLGDGLRAGSEDIHDEFLLDGSTGYELHLLETASAPGPVVRCAILGTAARFGRHRS